MTFQPCQVTGTLVAPDGALLPEVQVQFLPAPVTVRGAGEDTLAPHPVSVVTDPDARLDIALAPGVYTVRSRAAEGREYPPFLIDVPAGISAVLGDILLHLPAPQSVYDAAASARVASKAAATAAEGAAAAATARDSADLAETAAAAAAASALGIDAVATQAQSSATAAEAAAEAAQTSAQSSAAAASQVEADRSAATQAAEAAQTSAQSAGAAAQSAAQSAALSEASNRSFASRAAFEAAQLPADIESWTLRHAGHLLAYVRDPAATAIVGTSGVTGAPAAEIRPEHWGAVPDGSADCTAAINAAIAHAGARGGGAVLLRAERTYVCGGTILHHPLVTVRGDGGTAIVRLADGANTRLWQTLDFDAQKASGTAGIVRGIGLIDLLFSGNRANNPGGSGVFLAESGGYLQNVQIDDFAGTGFERAGFRTVDFNNDGSGNYPTSPFVRRVETHINDLFVWRSGNALAPAAYIGGPGDLRCGHLFIGGNNGKAVFACDSADYGYVHLYANGAATPGQYANEIVSPSMFASLEVRDCNWSGVDLASDEIQVAQLYATKNGRHVADGTGRQVRVSGNRCTITDAYIAAKLQQGGTLPGDGSMPLLEITGNQNTVKGKLLGNIGGDRRAAAGLIHGAGTQNTVDVLVFGVNGPAVRFDGGTQCELRANIANCLVGLEKNAANFRGAFLMPIAGVTTAVTGADAVARGTERWAVSLEGVNLTEQRVLSGDIDGTATGTGFLAVPHGLLSQPTFGDIQVSVVRGTSIFPGDAQIEAYAESRDATNVYVRWRVRTASGIPDARFRVAVWARLGL